jgi:hypothetical protein
MTRSGPLGRWDPFHPLDMLASLWTAASPVSSGATTVYQTLVAVRRLLVGRGLTVRLDGHDLTLTVTHFESSRDLRRLAVGQLKDVRIVARDIEWNGNRVDRASAVLPRIHLRPGSPPVLVAAPVEITLELPTDALDDVFRWAIPRLTGGVGPDAVARLHWARRPAMGNLEIDARLDGSRLLLKPSALVLRGQRWALPSRVPAYPVSLPDLPHGLTLTGVDFGPNRLHLTGTLPEWRVAVPATRLEDVINQLTSVNGPLNLTKAGHPT